MYERAKEHFGNLDKWAKRARFKSVIGTNPGNPSTTIDRSTGENKAQPGWEGPKDGEFFSMEEYTRYRISSSPALGAAYRKLLEQPSATTTTTGGGVDGSSLVDHHIDKLKKVGQWPWEKGVDIKKEQRWMLELYADEVVERFGGLAIVEKSLLPMGVMNLLRNRMVVWQGVH